MEGALASYKSYLLPRETQNRISMLSTRNFFRGSIVMQISFVMLIFLLFSDQILEGDKLLAGAPPAPLWRNARSYKICVSVEGGKINSRRRVTRLHNSSIRKGG